MSEPDAIKSASCVKPLLGERQVIGQPIMGCASWQRELSLGLFHTFIITLDIFADHFIEA